MISSQSSDPITPVLPPAVSPTVSPALPLSVAQANEAIRQYVVGRRSWSALELAELDRLRGVWRAALDATVR
jgi:hypothetical protein